MKTCNRCSREKPLDQFWKQKGGAQGRFSFCIECCKERDREAGRHTGTKNSERVARYRAKNRERIIDYLNSHPCVDCGFSDVRALQFDHIVDGKYKNVKDMTGHSWDKIWAEIQKCEVRCANCHFIVTAQRRIL